MFRVRRGKGAAQRDRRPWTLTWTRARAACVVIAGVVASFVVGSSNAAAAEPPTVFGYGTTGGILDGWNTPDNQVFWGIQDFQSPAKAFFSFNTTPALGVPTPLLLLIGVLPSGKQYVAEVPTTFTKNADPPAINSSVASVTWVPARHAFHLTVDVPVLFKCDLWISGVTGAAALPTWWDNETSYLNESIGAGMANGTITFPGSLTPTTVANWGAEQDTEYGTYLDGIDAYKPAQHIGYEYAVSQNPDGSGDLLLAFAERDGVWRGLLAHTTAAGQVSECEPGITLSHWVTDAVTRFEYPLQVTATCTSPRMSMTWYGSVSAPWIVPEVVPFPVYSFTVADIPAHSTVAGSVAVVQHFREKGSFGIGPSFTATGLATPAPPAATHRTHRPSKRHRQHKRHRRHTTHKRHSTGTEPPESLER
jgi:hypothetical protein